MDILQEKMQLNFDTMRNKYYESEILKETLIYSPSYTHMHACQCFSKKCHQIF